MGPSPRLPDLTPADAGRAFVMRRGSTRYLVVPDGSQEPRVCGVAVTLAPVDGARAEGTPSPRRYRVEAVQTGRPPRVGTAEARTALAVILAIYESAASGRPVTL